MLPDIKSYIDILRTLLLVEYTQLWLTKGLNVTWEYSYQSITSTAFQVEVKSA